MIYNLTYTSWLIPIYNCFLGAITAVYVVVAVVVVFHEIAKAHGFSAWLFEMSLKNFLDLVQADFHGI